MYQTLNFGIRFLYKSLANGFLSSEGIFSINVFFREDKIIYMTKIRIRIKYCKVFFVGEGAKHGPFHLQTVHAYSRERQAQTVLLQLHITHIF